MNPAKTLLLSATMLLFAACKKEDDGAVTRPVDFTGTNYKSLGGYDDNGKPDNLLPPDKISEELTTYIEETLPERTDLRQTNPELLKSKAIADIAVTQRSDIFITFVSQGTGFHDVIGFYTYPTASPLKSAKDIKEITYIFPNAGPETSLKAGDKVKIGRFEPGTSVGFVLLEGAWDPVTKTVNEKAPHFCSNDVLNPEVDPDLKKHAVLINYEAENKMLIGFEDFNRTRPDCDHDFNDVVLYATVVKS